MKGEIEIPKLAMFLGSRGGYFAFKLAMEELYKDVVKKGVVYLVEHRYRPEGEDLILDFQSIGMDLKDHEVKDGMLLENGFYLCPGITHERDKIPSIAIKKDEREGVLKFHEFENPPKFEYMFSFQIDKAREAGYKDNMALVYLSGSGTDGCNSSMEKAGKGGSLIFIQDPDKAAVKGMPKEARHKAGFFGLDYEVLPPKGIGEKILEFFSC